LTEANKHQGTSMVEIYQNCNVFNDGAFFGMTDKDTKAEQTVFVEHGKPMIFANGSKGIKLDGFKPVVVSMDDHSEEDLWIHDQFDRAKANVIARFFGDPTLEGNMPRPFGIFYQEDRPCYEDTLIAQIDEAKESGLGNLDSLLKGNNTWVID
ncbi:MAG: 2-oxoglutarate ferredoxin oxidoreductase subunit beta, partial [Bacteroidia bacterium]